MKAGSKMGARHPDKREQRINRQTDYERVRSALRAGAANGFYVFDALMTDEAGLIDFLVVGFTGITVVVVRGEHGDVKRDEEKGELRIIRDPFKDDPEQQANEQIEDIRAKLSEQLAYLNTTAVPASLVVCFTRADLVRNTDPKFNVGLHTIWDLPHVFEQTEHDEIPAGEELSSEGIDEIARVIESIYARPPFVRPGEPYGGQTI